MKAKDIALTIFVIVLLIVGAKVCSSATPDPIPTPFDVSKIDFSQFTPEQIAATEKHRNELKGDVKQANEKISTVIADQGSSIADIQKATADSQLAFKKYESDTETRINIGNAAITSLAALVKKHHLDLIILCGLWVGLVGLIYLKVGLEMGPWGAGIAGVVAISGVAFILWRL